ncbi:TetR/AcrR family transcriptional regulator [Aquidulcibacter sp.]|jgi:DNA-binding transcriptional regulator YbjK|uniref:TetR/AcrR family transcriptional regulator n=1 Tax=Aquidulcibacter sp. TaxID=2052990 RepID=UPI0037BFFD88
MPKIVDHNEVRQDIAAAAKTVITRDGLAGATVKKIASAAGYSASIGQHYFESRDDLLAFTFEHFARKDLEELRNRTQAAASVDDKLIAAIKCLFGSSSLAGDPDRAIMFLNYFASGMAIPMFRELQAQLYCEYLDTLTEIFDGCSQTKHFELTPSEEAAFLLALSDGVALAGVSAPAEAHRVRSALLKTLIIRYKVDLHDL